MVQSWYMDDDVTSDCRLEHHRSPREFVAVENLLHLAGVEYYHIGPNDDAQLERIKRAKNINYEDTITCSKDCLPEYEKKLKIFFEEHLHTDEEIRYVVDGSGYFDVRDKGDRWIRIHVTVGDLLIVPAGIYHRFTLDTNNYIKAVRYFSGEPIWTPHNRPTEEMASRKEYLRKLERNEFVNV